MHNPVSHEREKTEDGSEFSRSTKVTILSKKQKEDAFSKMLHSKGLNGHGNAHNSKSVGKNGKVQQKQHRDKNISLEKHQNREIITKTQTGFYIMTNGGVISEKEEYSPNAHSRNKIYNAKSPRAKGPPKRNNMLTKEAE